MSKQRKPSRFIALGQNAVAGRDIALKGKRSIGDRLTFNFEPEIFHGHRHTGKGTVWQSIRDLVFTNLWEHGGETIQLFLRRLRAGHRLIQEFTRADIAFAHEFCQTGGIIVCVIVHHSLRFHCGDDGPEGAT